MPLLEQPITNGNLISLNNEFKNTLYYQQTSESNNRPEKHTEINLLEEKFSNNSQQERFNSSESFNFNSNLSLFGFNIASY